MTGSAVNDDDDIPPVPGAQVPLTPATGKQRLLLVIVITLGVLILLALGALVTGFITGAARRGGGSDGKPWSYSLDVPAGTRVAGTSVDGNRLTVHLVSPEGEEVVLLDAATGKVIGRLQVKPHK